ncbi:MAG: Uma2 family endonuclease [Cyanobacteria bacterium P01_F01_bin.150]
MDLALSPQIVSMSWQDYIARNYDRAIIPWDRYRYSGTGVIEVGGEAIQNVEIADELRDRFKAEIKRLGLDWKTYQNSLSVEVEHSIKQERIPDVLVIDGATRSLMDRESRIITKDMPAPILIVEVVSPSSKVDDLEDKPFEDMGRGVGEYLSINWRNEIVMVWSRTEDGKTYNVVTYHVGEQVALQTFPELMITVDQLILKE